MYSQVVSEAQVAEERWTLAMHGLGASPAEIALAQEIGREVTTATLTRYQAVLDHLRYMVAAGVPSVLWRAITMRHFSGEAGWSEELTRHAANVYTVNSSAPLDGSR